MVASQIANHSIRFQRFLQVHRDQRAMHVLEFLEHAAWVDDGAGTSGHITPSPIPDVAR